MSVDLSEFKLIVKGLPFETTIGELLGFLDLENDPEVVDLVPWKDQVDRCKGHAFINCRDQQQMEDIMNYDEQLFESGGNSRTLKVEQFRAKSEAKKMNREREENKFLHEENGETKREVYVSNLAFTTTEEDLEMEFGKYGTIEKVTIPKIYNSGRPKGFAFVRYSTEEEKFAAIENLNRLYFKGREIGVRANKGKAQGNKKPAREANKQKQKRGELPPGSTTIYVGNLPWAHEESELEQLFQPFGDITRTTLVRKSWNAKSRGFGYVEFATPEATMAAYRAGNEEPGIYSLQEGNTEPRKLNIDYAEPKKLPNETTNELNETN